MKEAEVLPAGLRKPISPLRVACPSCGQPRGRDCVDLTVGLQGGVQQFYYPGHGARRAKAQQLYGGENR